MRPGFGPRSQRVSRHLSARERSRSCCRSSPARPTRRAMKNEPHLKEPKSKAGKRTIALPPFVLTAFRDLRTTRFERARLQPRCSARGRVTTWTRRTSFGRFGTSSRKRTPAAQKTAKESQTEPELIPAAICFHDLRHTHASLLIAAGHSIKAVSRRLGHGTIEIALRVCAYLMPNDDEKLAMGSGIAFG